MSQPMTLAVVSAGAMGSAVARRLVEGGCTVLTNLDGRSAATHERARAAGMLAVPLGELAARAAWVLSILPPGAALAFARAYRAALPAALPAPGPVFAECNAVGPGTARRVAGVFAGSGVQVVDAGIVGGPPRAGYDPVFYASAGAGDGAAALDAFAGLARFGLRVAPLRGAGVGIGDASALKMSYAGITKGITGLCTTMILAAHAASPATAEALLQELAASQPQTLGMIARNVPGMLPKAYRWVAEMEEISAFVGPGEGDIHRGMARLYERIERGLESAERADGDGDGDGDGDSDGGDIAVLRKFAEDAKAIMETK